MLWTWGKGLREGLGGPEDASHKARHLTSYPATEMEGRYLTLLGLFVGLLCSKMCLYPEASTGHK